MTDIFSLSGSPGLLRDNLMLVLLGAAMLAAAVGAAGLVFAKNVPAQRMRALAASPDVGVAPPKLTKTRNSVPTGIMKTLIPDDPSEIAQIDFQLNQCGLGGPNAVRNFFLVRLGLALSTPVLVVLSALLASAQLLPQALNDMVTTATGLRLLQVAAVGGAMGFYGPGYWLQGRLKARRKKIQEAFPNALDLLQISVEAGLGFDAAMSRVGQEISRISPEISYEFLFVLQEVQAGRDREQSMSEMAERMGIVEATSFVTVVAQSMQFGTSLSVALRNYAIEMRENRELAAQEKANRLPVQMSAVMSLMMLPALFLITLAPIIIRYVSIF